MNYACKIIVRFNMNLLISQNVINQLTPLTGQTFTDIFQAVNVICPVSRISKTIIN
jgi:hypothetical protein